jgi:hypothetical protein
VWDSNPRPGFTPDIATNNAHNSKNQTNYNGIVDPTPTESRLRFIRIKIKETEDEMNYFMRRFTDLDSKETLTDKEKKDFQRVLTKLQRLNQELADLWTEEERATPLTEEEIAAAREKAYSEGRSYFPFADERLGKQFQANNLLNRRNGLVERLNSAQSDASIPESLKKELETEIHRLEGLLAKLDEEGIKPNPNWPH